MSHALGASPLSTTWTHHRARVAALSRSRTPGDPDLTEARRNLAAERRAERVAQIVAETRAAQGLPPRVTDPAALERVAAVLRLIEQPYTGTSPDGGAAA
jgi:hypothetical protein